MDFEAGLDAVPKLTAAFDHKKALLLPGPGFFLQEEQILDFRVLRRCDGLDAHQNFSGRMVGKKRTSWMVSCPVMNMVRRSMPMPIPEVGGMPYSRARTKS